jgi:hypothetical protein
MPGAFDPFPLATRDEVDGIPARGINRAACDAAEVGRVVPFALIRVSCNASGAPATVVDYVGQNGVGLAHAPSIVGSSLRWPSTFVDERQSTVALRLTEVLQLSSETSLSATEPVVVSARVLNSTDVSVAAASADSGAACATTATIVVGAYADTVWTDYGGDAARVDSDNPPVAWGYFRIGADSLGTAYDETEPFIGAELLAEARLFGAIHRSFQKASANALPGTADEALDDWAAELGVRVGRDRPAARAFAAAIVSRTGDDAQTLADVTALAAVALGQFFVGVSLIRGADLANPPVLTLSGAVTGSAAQLYDLGGGAWTSSRAMLLIDTVTPVTSELAEYQQRVTVDLPAALHDVIPAWASWAITAGGQFWTLDVSRLGIETALGGG